MIPAGQALNCLALITDIKSVKELLPIEVEHKQCYRVYFAEFRQEPAHHGRVAHGEAARFRRPPDSVRSSDRGARLAACRLRHYSNVPPWPQFSAYVVFRAHPVSIAL